MHSEGFNQMQISCMAHYCGKWLNRIRKSSPGKLNMYLTIQCVWLSLTHVLWIAGVCQDTLNLYITLQSNIICKWY